MKRVRYHIYDFNGTITELLTKKHILTKVCYMLYFIWKLVFVIFYLQTLNHFVFQIKLTNVTCHLTLLFKSTNRSPVISAQFRLLLLLRKPPIHISI